MKTALKILVCVTLGLRAASGFGQDIAVSEPVDIGFADLFTNSDRGLVPTGKLRDLDGKLIRLTGFLVRGEEDGPGQLHLSPRPVHLDESGGRIGDLPPNAVLIVFTRDAEPSATNSDRLVEVTGFLQAGRRALDGASPAAVRIVVSIPPVLP